MKIGQTVKFQNKMGGLFTGKICSFHQNEATVRVINPEFKDWVLTVEIAKLVAA